MAIPSAHTVRLTRQTVLHEAIALLDAEGFDALTMRRLAERLGVVPMAIYRHVANKEDLIVGVLDVAVSLVPLPSPDLPWRDGLDALARAIRSTMLAHPGIVGPLVSLPSLGPHGLAIGAYALGLMHAAGFGDTDAAHAPNAVITYTIGFVALEVPRLNGPAEVLDSEFVSEAQFDYGLKRLLDGIAATAPRKASRSRR